jgi:hypothetical protein
MVFIRVTPLQSRTQCKITLATEIPEPEMPMTFLELHN